MRSYYWYYDNLKDILFLNLLSGVMTVDVISEKFAVLLFYGFWTCLTLVLNYL